MPISRDYKNDFITLDQENYIDEILKISNMSQCNSVSCPLDLSLDLNDVEGEICKDSLPYRGLIN